MDKRILAHFKRVDSVLYKYALTIEILPLVPSKDYFTHLCNAIISQQLSGKVGDVIFARFQSLFPNQKISPEYTLTLPNQTLRDTGMSMTKVQYIKNLAQSIVSKEILLEALSVLPEEVVISELIKLKGIGRWTAEMFLMFALGREDIFSYGDLGLRRGIQYLYNLPKEPTQSEAETITASWSPYRTYACRILWKYIGTQRKPKKSLDKTKKTVKR